MMDSTAEELQGAIGVACFLLRKKLGSVFVSINCRDVGVFAFTLM